LCFGGQFFTFFDDQRRVLFGKRPIDDLLRRGGDFFFGSKRSHENPFFDHRFGVREIGVLRIGVAPNSGLWADDLVAVLLASGCMLRGITPLPVSFTSRLLWLAVTA
jgi:hypothetical protein